MNAKDLRAWLARHVDHRPGRQAEPEVVALGNLIQFAESAAYMIKDGAS